MSLCFAARNAVQVVPSGALQHAKNMSQFEHLLMLVQRRFPSANVSGDRRIVMGKALTLEGMFGGLVGIRQRPKLFCFAGQRA